MVDPLYPTLSTWYLFVITLVNDPNGKFQHHSALRSFPQDRNQQDKSHPYLPDVDLVAESSGSRSVVREDRRPVAVPVGVD